MVTFPLQSTGRGRTPREQLLLLLRDAARVCAEGQPAVAALCGQRLASASSYLPLMPSLGACLAPRKPLPKHQSNPQTVVTVQLAGSGAPQALTCRHARSAAPRASARAPRVGNAVKWGCARQVPLNLSPVQWGMQPQEPGLPFHSCRSPRPTDRQQTNSCPREETSPHPPAQALLLPTGCPAPCEELPRPRTPDRGTSPSTQPGLLAMPRSFWKKQGRISTLYFHHQCLCC